MKHIYFNQYPEVNKNFVSDQSSCYPFIRDFNEAMIKTGLIRTQDPNQLDVNNIPNVSNLYDWFPANMSGHNIRYIHRPLIYTFNDELNATNPLYLYFYFYYATFTPSSADSHITSKVNIFLPGVQLEIRDKNGIRTPKTFIGIVYSADNNFNYITDYVENNHIKNKSRISNIDNKLLYLNICPGTFYRLYNLSTAIMPSQYSSNLTYYNMAPIMHFILRRYENGDYLFINGNLSYKAEMMTQPGTSFLYTRSVAYPTTIYNSTSDIFMSATTFYTDSYVAMNDYYNQRKIYAFPLQYYVPNGDGKLKIDDCLLVGNKNVLPETYNANINISLDQNITKKYFPLSTNFTNVRFNASDDITLLVRDE